MKCPNCEKETAYRGNPFRPFCSERCKLIDLGKWASGVYRIATEEQLSPDSGELDGNVPDE